MAILTYQREDAMKICIRAHDLGVKGTENILQLLHGIFQTNMVGNVIVQSAKKPFASLSKIGMTEILKN